MANPTTIVRKGDTIDFGSSVGIGIEVQDLLDAETAEPSAQGVKVWDGTKTVRIMDVFDVDGKPMEFKVSVRAIRQPANVDEAEACEKLRETADMRKTKKAETEAAVREREIMRAAELTRAAILDRDKSVDLGAKVREALALTDALGSAMRESSTRRIA